MVSIFADFGGGARDINRRHLIPIPDNDATAEANVPDLDEEQTTMEPDSNQDEAQDIPDTEDVPEPVPEAPHPPLVPEQTPELRRSGRRTTHKDCQSCIGCKKIECTCEDQAFPALPRPIDPDSKIFQKGSSYKQGRPGPHRKVSSL